MNTSPLLGLALLNVNWRREGTTYIDNFVPMVCEVVRSSGDRVVTAPLVQAGLRDRFGLKIPQQSVTLLIKRAHKRDYLLKDQGVYKPNPAALQNLGFEERRQQVLTLYEAITDELVGYCRANHDFVWSVQQADVALQSYLRDYSLDVAISDAENSPVPPLHESPSASRLIVNSFVRFLQADEPGKFSLFLDLVKGAMLANALYVPDPYRIEQRFENVSLFFDSPLLLYMAGYGPDARVRPRQELLDLLQDLGAQLACFRQTVDEARGILNACSAIMRNDAYNEAYGPLRDTIDHFYSNGYISTDVDRFSAALEDRLKWLGVRIEDRPAFDREYQVDEVGFERYLEETMGYAIVKEEALRHDVDVVSNIVRLRRGQPKHSIENADAIFVTHNVDLVAAAREFFRNDRLQGSVSLVMSDYHITNVAWLKNPSAGKTLPMRKVLADCHAALQPSEAVWTEFLKEVEHLREAGGVTSEEYYLLRHSQEVKAALVEVTLDDPSAVTEGTPQEVLERARRRRHRELEESLERETKGRRVAEGELRAHIRETEDRIGQIAAAVGSSVGMLFKISGVVVLALGLFKTFPWRLPAIDDALSDYIWSAVLLIMFAFLLWSTFVGRGLMAVIEWVESAVSRRVERGLSSLFGVASRNDIGAGENGEL